jgi:hypothetical protein
MVRFACWDMSEVRPACGNKRKATLCDNCHMNPGGPVQHKGRQVGLRHRKSRAPDAAAQQGKTVGQRNCPAKI